MSATKINEILKDYDATQPFASVPALLELRQTLRALGDDSWATEKRSELDGIIAACLGLHLEAVTEKPAAQPGENLTLQVEAINRSPVAVKFQSLRVLTNGEVTPVGKVLVPNEVFIQKTTVALPKDLPFSHPYWLRQPGTVGTYAVSDQTLIGRPENPPSFPVEVTLRIGGEEITYSLEPRFRKVDRVAGEVSEPLVIAPPAFVELPRPVFVFGNKKAKTINVRVIASAEKFSGNVALEVPAGWKVEPVSIPVKLEGTDSEMSGTFQLTPPPAAGEGELRAAFVSDSGERTKAFSRQRIEYSHIEPQTLDLACPGEAR